jgi:hypothetical protein
VTGRIDPTEARAVAIAVLTLVTLGFIAGLLCGIAIGT